MEISESFVASENSKCKLYKYKGYKMYIHVNVKHGKIKFLKSGSQKKIYFNS
jgi:hypothetical protein